MPVESVPLKRKSMGPSTSLKEINTNQVTSQFIYIVNYYITQHLFIAKFILKKAYPHVDKLFCWLKTSLTD
ncbi:hypothetical protein BME96_00015 [Virgibacillus halodenitrificans]|uniref:Uncharacterized protein n=1 Tax=Virgibacillus halodenitrificans TaxID=1482 RepID=A0AAC9NJH9_VIRHA|nr:hypothetical protein BME96_00015 [Virgibacillus halodenitrificans]